MGTSLNMSAVVRVSWRRSRLQQDGSTQQDARQRDAFLRTNNADVRCCVVREHGGVTAPAENAASARLLLQLVAVNGLHHPMS